MGKASRRHNRAGSSQRGAVAGRPRLALAFIALSTALAVAILAIGAITYFADRDWRAAATVNGVSISRAELRDRQSVIEGLQRLLLDRTGSADAGQAAAIERVLEGDPREISKQQLVEDVLMRAEATRRGLVIPVPVDTSLAVERVVNGSASLRVVWVRLASASRSTVEAEATATRVSAALAAGESGSAAAAGVDASWRAIGAEAWIDRSGVGLPTADSLPPAILLSARARNGAGSLPLYDDKLGHLYVAAVASTRPGPTIGLELVEALKAFGASESAISAWATGQFLRDAIAEALLAEWQRVGGAQIRMAELPLGRVSPGLPEVALAVVNVSRLDASDPRTKSAALLAELVALPALERASRFDALATQANGDATLGPLERSGELGWFAREELLKALGDAAFDPAAKLGDVLGPIDTPVGPELFLLEARYSGSLDDRAAAIAIMARRPGADFLELARQVQPDDAQRATGGPWRALAEFDEQTTIAAGLQDAAIGELVGPVDIDGTVVLGRLLERRTAAFDAGTIDRLRAFGFSNWLSDQLAKASIALDPDGVGASRETLASADTSAPGIPALPWQSTPTQRAPVNTPNFPTPALP